MSEPTRDQKIEATRARMAELAVRFLDRTEGDIAAMRGALERVAAGDSALLGEIRHFAHRMVGTGATLGFASISALAQEIERLAESCVPGVAPGESMCAQLDSAIAALSAEYSRQAGGRGAGD